MDAPLILAGLAMGVAASPHCVVMCGAPCAALTQGSARSSAGFHVGRVLGYAAGGALAASSVAALSAWTQAAPALRPLWTLLHLAFLALGLWWLATGRQPEGWQRDRAVVVAAPRSTRDSTKGSPRRALRASAAGIAWVAWPCGALQAALLLSALASSAQSGALTMAAFAVASAPALALAPWAWGRWATWRKAHGADASAAAMTAIGYRVAGASLVLAAGWALTHGLWMRFAAWCGL